MSQINTSLEAIDVGKKIIENFKGMLGSTASKLNTLYTKAGQDGWNDKKYHELGEIIQECNTELNRPITELEQLSNKLEQLRKAVENYSN